MMQSLSFKSRVVLFVLAIALLCVAVFAHIEYSKRNANVVKVLVSTPKLQSVEIGNYNNVEEGQRAAIQELSRQIKLHPKVDVSRVCWDKDFYLEFDRDAKTLREFNPPNTSNSWHFFMSPPFVSKGLLITEGGLKIKVPEPIVAEQDIYKTAKRKMTVEQLYSTIKRFHKK